MDFHKSLTSIIGGLMTVLLAVGSWAVQRQIAINDAQAKINADAVEWLHRIDNRTARINDVLSVLADAQSDNTQRLLDHMRRAHQEDVALRKLEQRTAPVAAQYYDVPADAPAAKPNQ